MTKIDNFLIIDQEFTIKRIAPQNSIQEIH